MPGQTLQLFVTGGDAVQGMNLNAQIGTDVADDPAPFDAPHLTAGNILTGTIFATNNNGQGGSGVTNHNRIFIGTVTTASGTVNANGLIATLTVDTSNVTGGTYPLLLSGTFNGNTTFPPTATTSITNGTITVVPEPATAGLFVAAGGLIAVRRRRR